MAVSLLALLDDIATILDDVAILTKVAAKKTAGVLGDDLALNAQQVSGVRAVSGRSRPATPEQRPYYSWQSEVSRCAL